MSAIWRSPRDHRPYMPEVAWRRLRSMPWCGSHERAARAASEDRPGTTRVRRVAIHSSRDLPALGQRATNRVPRGGTACARSRRPLPATARTVAARPAGPGTSRPRANVAGRRPDRPTRRALLGEVRLWPTAAIGDARGRREVYDHALPSVWRAAAVSVSPPDNPEQLRPETPSSSAAPSIDARWLSQMYRRGGKGRHLSVGIKETNTITRTLATRPGVGTPRAARNPRTRHAKARAADTKWRGHSNP